MSSPSRKAALLGLAVLSGGASLVLAHGEDGGAPTAREAADAGPVQGNDDGGAAEGGETVRRGGRPYLLLGRGTRSRGEVADYTLALFVDEVGARRAFPALAARAGGRSRDKLLGGDKAPPFVVWGDFGKLAVMRLARDATGAEVRGYFEEGLGALLGDHGPVGLRDRLREVLAFVGKDGRRGDEIVLHTSPGGEVEVTVGGQRSAAVVDARVARALWEIWLGSKPVSTELRRALVDRIDALGR